MISDIVLTNAHTHCSNNKYEIEDSELCGCFYCKNAFPAEDVREYTPPGKYDRHAALCPKCGIDSVIGSASGLDVTSQEFLNAMYERWFNTYADNEEVQKP